MDISALHIWLLVALSWSISSCGNDRRVADRAPNDITPRGKNDGIDHNANPCESEIFCLNPTKTTSGIDFNLQTFAKSQITIQINFTLENLQASTTLPISATFGAGVNKKIVALTVIDPLQGYKYSVSYSWVWGYQNAKHDDSYSYRLPYLTGESHSVTQGYDGSFSHFDSDANSTDFGMEIGTEIYAARDGIVANTQDGFTEGGSDPSLKSKANSITILHSDGTLALYAHLQNGGLYVSEGDVLSKGDVIGRSGNTGYTTGPHLHFEVYYVKDLAKIQSVPVKFKAQDGSSFTALEGTAYTAAE